MIESTRFGRYHLVDRLGVGAMGSVYRARDESLGRDVAIKTIHTLGRSDFQREMLEMRFDQEARALAALSHPHVVNVFDVGVEDETPYLVMELVEGASLADRLARRPGMSPDEVGVLGGQIGAALDAAHARNIVHRDVKPGNILEAGPGLWKLADFGIAHVPESSLTLTGQFLGSPAYAAPESLGRGEYGPPSDVYGLGATLYEALAGTPPFGPGGLMTPGALATTAPPRSLAELCPAAPPHMVHAIMAAIDRDPARRSTAAQLAAALQGRSLPVAPQGNPLPVAPRGSPPAVAAPTFADVPRAQSLLPGSRRRLGAIAIAIAILIVGIALGAGMSSDDGPATSEPGAAPATLSEPPPRSGPPTDKELRKIEKDWRKVDDKLREGKVHDALEHLDKILERDPHDEQARILYEQLDRIQPGDVYYYDGYSYEYDD